MPTAASIRGFRWQYRRFFRPKEGVIPCRILDLSPGGAKLDCPISVSVGTAVILDCGTLGRSAVVRWQNAGVMGVCFDSELDAREASALIDRSEAMAARMKT